MKPSVARLVWSTALLASLFAQRALAAENVLEASGVKGGLVVHLGCGDGTETVSLCAGESYLVHGLDTDPAAVAKARRHVLDSGLYGQVSIDVFDGRRLPYVDNLVNLLVADELGDVPRLEVLRVLAPKGVAIVGGGKIAKPWPDEIDQWTHFLYDASGNAVAHDERVGSPRRMQWMAGPKRARDHDALSSTSVITSSGGRMFYIFDEGPTSQSHRPADWKLVARDAFNGVLLWKRDVPTWVTHLFFFRTGPVQMTRRLVSVDDRLYVTLGFDAPVSKLDAATGQTLLTYPGSENTEEIIYHDDVLLTVAGDPNLMNEEAPKVFGYWELSVDREPEIAKSIVAYRADSGEVLWRKTGDNLAHLVPLSLSAKGDKAFFLDNENLHCVEAKTGRDLWKTPFATKGLFLRNYAPTVVVHRDVVMCLTYDRLCSFAVDDGRKLWEHKGAIGFASPGDLFGIDELAWVVPMTSGIWKDNKLDQDGKIVGGVNLPTENFLGNEGREIWGIDIHSGEVKRTLPRLELLPGGHHHRCYRNKATEQFLICGRRGLEYVDLEGDNHVNNWWLRGACQYGVMPANGMIYIPPDPCQCFNFIKVNGFYALSDKSSLDELESVRRQKLEKGPAYKVAAGKSTGPTRTQAATSEGLAWQPPIREPDSEDWPTYRGDITRSGSTRSPVPAGLDTLWKADLGGKLSAAVVSDGRLYVASTDAGVVHCLDAQTGKRLWQFVAGGRVDSPPTICDELCVFGSGDGSVYCLESSSGKLAWRFCAADVDCRVIADNRLESIWPISGSVLVQDGIAYFAAGRSSYLDGGIRLYGLDVCTGRMLHETLVSATPIYPGKEKSDVKSTGALPDVLVSDGRRINMRHVQFDADLEQIDPADLSTLFSTTGLLEDAWMHRQNWSLGSPAAFDSQANAGGYSPTGKNDRRPAGKLIVFDDTTAYGVLNPYTWLKKTAELRPPSHDGHLHQKYSRYKLDWFPVGVRIYARANTDPGPPPAKKRGRREEPAPETTTAGWAVDEPIQPRAMVLAGEHLFMAGWHDAATIKEQTGRPQNAENPDPRQTVLRAVSTTDGSTVAEYPLPAEPVFDGIAAANRRLFIPLKDGTVVSMGK